MKKIQYGFSVLETLLIVVIISIIGSIGWYVINQNNDSGNDQTSATVVNDATGSEVVTSLKKSIPLKYKNLKVADLSAKNGGAFTLTYSVPGYKYNVEVLVKDDSKVQFHAPNQKVTIPADLKTTIEGKLSESGFKEVKKLPPYLPDTTHENFTASYFMNTKGICVLSVSTYSNVENNESLLCASKAEFLKDAKETIPFAEAYNKSKISSSEPLVIMGKPDNITTTKSKQYNYTVASLGGRGGYFYKKINETTWHFYGSSFEGLSCKDISDNKDAKLAFADMCDNGTY
jgi:hypothetical protein